MITAIRIEFCKAKRTFVAVFPAIGLIFAVLSMGFSTMVSGQGFAATPYAWHSVYATGLATPLCALLAASPERREAKALQGGLNYRPLSPHQLRLARLIVVMVSGLGFQALSFGPLLIFNTSLPVVEVGFLSWLGMLGLLGIFTLMTRLFGWAVTLLLSILWQIATIAATDTSYWFFLPPAWPLRILLVPMNINVNSTPLAADSIIRSDNPLLGVALCLVLSIIGSLCAAVAPPARPRLSRHNKTTDTTAFHASFSTTNRPPWRGFPNVLPTMLSWRRSGIYPLTILAILSVVLVRWHYSPSAAQEFFTYLVMPVGIFVLACLSWRLAQPTYYQLYCESLRALSGFLGAHIVIIFTVISATTLLTQPPAQMVILWFSISSLLLCCALFLAIHVGIAATLITGICLTVFGLTIGGDVLATTFLWIFAPSAWPVIVGTSSQLLMALGLNVIFLTGAGWMLRQSFRKYLQTS